MHAEAKSTIMTNEHTSLEKYTSHTLFEMVGKGCERVMYERWIGDWTKPATYWPPVPPSLAALLSRSARLLNWGPWGPSSLLGLVLTATNWLQLTELPVTPGYIIVCRPPASCERHICTKFTPSTVKVIPWYFWPDAPVPWSTARLEVNMLQEDLPCSQR